MTATLTLITGADKGIGFETAMALAKLGQHVLLGSRHQDQGQQAVDKIRQAGYDAELVILDVTKQSDIDRAKARIDEKYGYLDVLINKLFFQLNSMRCLSSKCSKKLFEISKSGVGKLRQTLKLPSLYWCAAVVHSFSRADDIFPTS